MVIEPIIPADVLRLCRRASRLGAAGRPARLTGGQHELYRVGIGAAALVLKIIENDAGAQQREIRARELFAPGIPIPAVLFHGRIRGSSRYLVTPWVNGVPLSTALLHLDAFPAEIAFENAATLLGRLHALAATIQQQSERVFPLAPAVMLGFGTADFLRRFAAATDMFRERFGPLLWDRVSAAIAGDLDTCEGALAETVLCHGDYQPKNLIFNPVGQVRALIDWELAAFAPRLADLAHLLRYALSDAVEASLRQGYAAGCDLPESWTRAARCYDLVRVTLGLSRPGDISGASDIPQWIEFIEGCVDALLRADPQRLRRAARVFLVQTA
jgi:Ser/Thr protein kinase RdoA (MazF antagonist)